MEDKCFGGKFFFFVCLFVFWYLKLLLSSIVLTYTKNNKQGKHNTKILNMLAMRFYIKKKKDRRPTLTVCTIYATYELLELHYNNNQLKQTEGSALEKSVTLLYYLLTYGESFLHFSFCFLRLSCFIAVFFFFFRSSKLHRSGLRTFVTTDLYHLVCNYGYRTLPIISDDSRS